MISLIAACVFVIQVGRASENQGASRREAYATAREALGDSMCSFRTIPDTCREFDGRRKLYCLTRRAMFMGLSDKRVHFITPPRYRNQRLSYEGARRCSMSFSSAMNAYCDRNGQRVSGHIRNVKFMKRYL